jgi:hypothetical protein
VAHSRFAIRRVRFRTTNRKAHPIRSRLARDRVTARQSKFLTDNCIPNLQHFSTGDLCDLHDARIQTWSEAFRAIIGWFVRFSLSSDGSSGMILANSYHRSCCIRTLAILPYLTFPGGFLMSFSLSAVKRCAFGCAAAVPLFLLSGCANMITNSPAGPSLEFGAMTGKVHGGNQPISGAVVKLYAAGTTGYGTGSTLLASTTTSLDGSGSFSFTQVPTQPGSLGSSYACPSSKSLIYLVSSGGDPLNNNGSNNNTAAVMMAALGQCGSASGLFVNINEASTVASVFALAQYINPGSSTPASVTIGTNGDYTLASPPQAGIGLINAFATVPNLENLATGLSNTTFTPTTGGGAAGVTVTGTPESAKINTMANILASCVNNANASATNCATLFSNAIPPTASVTSQPTATFSTAVDTLQAAYYMATNPIDSVSTSPNTTNIAALYGLASANAAFQTTLSAQPLDWTIGISYTATGTCTNANSAGFLASPETVAVDAGGNVWMLNGATGATNALVQFGPTGAPQKCLAGNITTGRGLTIDTNGNVWAVGSVASSSAIYEYLTNGTSLTWPATYAAAGIVADGSGNIFYSPSTGAVSLQEFPGAASASVAAVSSTAVGSSVASAAYLYLAADHAGNIYAPNASGNNLYEWVAGNSYAWTDLGSTSTVVNGYGASIDRSGYIIGGNTCCANAVSNVIFKIAPTGTALTTTVSAKYPGGLVAPRSSAVDGANNYWFGMGYPTVPATVGPPATSTIFAIGETDSSFNSLSPQGTTPATCSSTNTNCYTNGGFQKPGLLTATSMAVRGIAIDLSGNVWAPSSAGAMEEIVGAAVPVVTPIVAAVVNNTLATKP